MTFLQAFITLLVLPPAETTAIAAWLRVAAEHLQGFSTQPEVVRRHINSSGMRAEVRRWSELSFLPLNANAKASALPRLFLHQDGTMLQRIPNGRRFLRNDPGDQIVDEIYKYVPVQEISPDYLRIVQHKAICHSLSHGYGCWAELTEEQRAILVGFGGGWSEAEMALESVEGEDHLHTLQLLLGDKAHPQLRQQVLEAGLDGRHRPNPVVLAWLLAQPDWNLNPSLVAMARNAVEDAPEQAWALIHHPNPQVRLRLADVFYGEADWVEWLINETDEKVRSRVQGALEQSYTPAALVRQLTSEKETTRKEAIGWALSHWRTPIEEPADWQALNRAITMGIGKQNRKDLQAMLRKQGKLSLRGRLGII